MTPFRVSAVLALALGLAACGSARQAPSASPSASPVATGHLALEHTSFGKASSLPIGSVSPSVLADDQRAFGADLLRETCVGEGTGNVTVSPASAAIALGLLQAGARGSTSAALSTLLHTPGWGRDLVAAYQAQHTALSSLKGLELSDRVYTSAGEMPDQRTLDDLASGFAAQLKELDFTQGSKATDQINSDVSKDTGGLIPELFDDPLPRDTRTVLTNAIHFTADWQTAFTSSAATAFTTDSGAKVSVQMMSGDEVAGPLRTSAGWQSVELPYKGDALSAFAVLPPAGTACSAVTGSRLTALTRGGSSSQAGVSMPELDLTQTHQLTDVLAKLGLPLKGDYGGLGSNDDQISTVVQKVYVKVDKTGTEAAAATGVGVTTEAVRIPPPVIVFDRPYLLMIQDTKTGTPLFLLRVSDPS